jgi:hypothetical protein
MNTLLNDDEAHEPLDRVSVRDPAGWTAVTLGLVATVYFEEPWRKEIREAVTNLAHWYLDQFADKLRWSEQPKTGRMRPMTSRHVLLPRDWLPQHDDSEEVWSFFYHGGEHELDASPFVVTATGTDSIRRWLGRFHVSFPLHWFKDRSGTFPEYLRSVSDQLKPISGYGGVGILESSSLVERRHHQAVVRTLAERFPGFEVEAEHVSVHHLKEGIKGVNWLTVLSDRWVEALGGLDALRARLDDSIFPFYPYDGGVVIQAGPKPVIGDVKANRWPTHYVTLAKVLKPIQIKNHYPMHFGGVGGLEHEATLAWLFRFDGK